MVAEIKLHYYKTCQPPSTNLIILNVRVVAGTASGTSMAATSVPNVILQFMAILGTNFPVTIDAWIIASDLFTLGREFFLNFYLAVQSFQIGKTPQLLHFFHKLLAFLSSPFPR